MPEVRFSLRWPDGAEQDCYSPSRSIEDAICAGASYPAGELLRRTRDALTVASERVREAYGFACTAAAAQIDELEDFARAHARESTDLVAVTALDVVEHGRDVPAPRGPDGHVGVVVVGGGQAGLSASRLLTERGIEHVVLERTRRFSSWREDRWDAFCLVTPNWQCRLPGHPYSGADPDGFMVKDEILDYLEAFAGSFDAPLVEGVAVHEVRAAGEDDGPGRFAVATSAGELTADHVILAVGGYHAPRRPAAAERLDPTITQLHSSEYRRPSSLRDGAVLVVGTGQSGAQIAEDLHLAGRETHLVVGTAPRMARCYRGRDMVAWMEEIGHYDLPIDQHPMGIAARAETNHYMTGRDGGRDIDLRAFAAEGMVLHGRLLGVDRDGVTLRFAGDLPANLDHADGVVDRAKDTVDHHIAEHGIDAPAEPRYAPLWAPDGDGSAPLDLADAGVTTIVWATGFRSDWSWVALPTFDGAGRPAHERGVCAVDGLYILGLPWLYTWGSGRFAAIARDAAHVVEHLAAAARTPEPAAARVATVGR